MPALLRAPVETFTRSIVLPVSAHEAFAWHERPGALEALTPPWEHIRVASMSDGIREGSCVTVRAKVGPVWTTWMMEHYGYVRGVEFNDRMPRGPFPLWEHRHHFSDLGVSRKSSAYGAQCVLTDTIRYRLPFGVAGWMAAGWYTRRKLETLFAWRHAVTRAGLR
jgi:ligand-binding SRPBCC domain-containing protein